MSLPTIWRIFVCAALLPGFVRLHAAAQERHSIRILLAALPDEVQSVVAIDREAYVGQGSAWAPYPSVFDVLAVMRVGVPDREPALQLLSELKPRRLVCAALRFRGPSNDLGPRAVDAVVILDCPSDVRAAELLRKSGAVDAVGEFPAGWIALTKSIIRPGRAGPPGSEPKPVVTTIIALPDGLVIAGSREADVRHVADLLSGAATDSTTTLERRWGKAATLVTETGMLQILREFDVRERQITPLKEGPPREGDARNILHFVIPSAAKLSGELHAFSSTREDWVLEALLGEHAKFEATPDGFVLHWGEIPPDCPDIRSDAQLIPLRIFGVPLFI